jgi:heat shock protein HspQ
MCAGAFIVLAMPAAASDGMGTVISIEGTAHAKRSGADISLARDTRVFQSDTLITGPDSKLQILLDDESSITIGPSSTVEMIEFSNDENDAKFASHLAEGRMRVTTGRTTERNPDGFRITTRHATIGIRGTILTVITAWDFTEIDVNEAKLDVLVNGRSIPQFYKIVIRDGEDPVITPLSPEEMMSDEWLTNLDKQVIALLTGQIYPSSFLGTFIPNAIQGVVNPNIMPGDGVNPLKFALNSNVSVAGNLLSNSGVAGTYSFNANLSSGAISNATMTGCSSCSVTFDLLGGSGRINGGRFNVRDFRGIVDANGLPFTDVGESTLDGTTGDGEYKVRVGGIELGSGWIVR